MDTINGDPLICTAGLKGVIRVFSPFPYRSKCALIGHGSSINDLKINHVNNSILLSASKDHTFRLFFIFKNSPLGPINLKQTIRSLFYISIIIMKQLAIFLYY